VGASRKVGFKEMPEEEYGQRPVNKPSKHKRQRPRQVQELDGEDLEFT